ncbi:MAG: Uma2 family endonuclease, partial [Candidatus Viridilinea halotolerans]
MNPYDTQLQPIAPPSDEEDPWRYGWRYVQRPDAPDGTELERVPLTLEDVLHPEVGDFIVHSDRHETDRMYLTQILRARLEPAERAVVLSDVRVAWDHAELRAHGPDVMVIPGLSQRQDWSTFDVTEEGQRPALIIEITSPETRSNDLTHKVAHYALVGVAQYVIVDDVRRKKPRQLRLIGYKLVGERYQMQPCDANGRLWLDVAQLWIGVRDDHVVCFDAEGNEIGDYLAVVHAAEAAIARADASEARASTAEARAATAEARVTYETQARAAAEAQVQAEAQ